ncbi:c-type cytochrome [Azospirillum sp.]|uniref:c-type cytochrome n=1 Tax=Azospirillum sp. TaxID=34012 RepID=UPI003D737F33
MFRTTLLTVLSVAGLLMATGASAADPAAQQGQAIAKEGLKPGVAACDTCHNSGTGPFPLLAGQRKDYIARQLKDFRTGKREHAMMTPIAKALNDAQSEAVAAFYAAQPVRKAPGPGAAMDLLERGAELAVLGEAVTSCDTCHGKGGDGSNDIVALAGQNPAYITTQIQAFRDGKRGNDNLSMMRNVAAKLKDADIKAVAAFYREVQDLVVELPQD